MCRTATSRDALYTCLDVALRLIHPMMPFLSEVFEKLDIGEDCWYRYDIGEDCWYRFDIGEDCWYQLGKSGWEKADIGEDCWLTAGSVTARPLTLVPIETADLKSL